MNRERTMKANALGILLGFMTYVVLNHVFVIDSLFLEAGVVAAIAAVIYVGLKLLERSKRQENQ